MTNKNDLQISDLALIGKRISEKRKAKGLSQDRLALKVNVSQSIIAKIEKGERNIQNDLLIKIADLLETNTDYLLRGTDTQNIKTVNDLHLSNEAVNNLRNFLHSDFLMQLDSAEDAVNFILSDRKGFNIISQIYAYLFSDCSVIMNDKKETIPADSLRIPLNSHLPKENATVSYHLSSEVFSDMILQRIVFNIKQWRDELKGSQKEEK